MVRRQTIERRRGVPWRRWYRKVRGLWCWRGDRLEVSSDGEDGVAFALVFSV